MSKFSCINILKSQAKELASEHGLQLSAALESVAKQSGFSSYHDLATVAKRDPREVRLMRAALGTDDLKEVVYEKDVFQAIDSLVEDALSSDIAMTNASGFVVDNLVATDVDFDERTGALYTEISFEYCGEQDPDDVFHGSTFYVSATLGLVRRQGEWQVAEPYGIELHSVERDVDWMSERDSWDLEVSREEK
ncbi:hypothetical protein [Pseudomaricurvus sp. HS19]|uniref:hypothetical protein n=1 Tax=Pseudomaricurvus sp. HS19 TaxID=2692626 RepID=UPI001368BF7C|nr:hypothetical protein [Pseudomaricurvus sp. HS19]MYM63317.1 hypothetical protein [Pseudomaricurvus sp. HS19]